MGISTEMFTIQNSIDANYLSIRLQDTTELDEISMKVIKEDCPEFLIPFRLTTVNNDITLKYKLINATALKYTSMTLPKDIFVQLYLNLLIPFIKGKDWFLDPHNICIDPQYVFCDNHTYKVYFIYVPERKRGNTDEEIMNFFKMVFANTTISDDKDFQVNLFRYFSNGEATLAGLYQMFKEERARLSTKEQLKPIPPKSFVNTANQVSEKMPANIPNTLKAEPRIEEKKIVENLTADEKNRNVIEDLFSDKKKEKPDKAKKKEVKEKKKEKEKSEKETLETGKKKGLGGLFGKKKESSVQKQMPMRAVQSVEQAPKAYMTDSQPQPLYQQHDLSDETEIFESVSGYGAASLELLDSVVPGAMPRIMLDFNGSYATIGRLSSDEIKPDIAFPSEFKRIGRQHARIERRGGEFFIIDLGSVNHTLLDGQILLPNQPYKLQNGMELTFTDSKPVRYRVRL